MFTLKETKLIYRTFPSADSNIPDGQTDKLGPNENKTEKNENPKQKLEETKTSNERELKRLNQRAQEVFRNGKNLINDISKNQFEALKAKFDNEIVSGDIEKAISSLEAISKLLDFVPENVESHARALQKLNSAKEAKMFEESEITILSTEDDPKIPERQFKIITSKSGMFPGGIIMKMDDINSHLFSKGLTKENIEKTYLEIAGREIQKLFERSEGNLPEEMKIILSQAISLNEIQNQKQVSELANIDTATLLDQQIDEKAEEELWKEYSKNQKIDFESGIYKGKPLEYTDKIPTMEKKEVEPTKLKEEKPQEQKQNPRTLTEEKTDISLLRKLAENKKEISPELENKLKELLTEKYKDLPLETRSETINLALRQTLLYYSRKLTQAQIKATQRIIENKETPKLEIY